MRVDKLSIRLTPYLIALPGLLLMIGILVYPIIWGFVLSAQELNLASLRPPRFVGLKNYLSLSGDPFFRKALIQTIVFVIVSLVLEFIIGLCLALLLQQRFSGYNTLRGIVLLPWMMAPVVTAFVWSWLLNGSYGIINYILLKAGIVSESVNWLSSKHLALLVVIFVDVWRSTPFVTLVLLAGLQGISEQLYEAAKIDGAGPLRRLFSVTLPLLKPAVTVALLMRTMMALRFFDIVWIMTRGGPAGNTEMLGTFAYKKSMLAFRMGYGSSVTTIIFFLSFLMSLGYIKILLGKRDM